MRLLAFSGIVKAIVKANGLGRRCIFDIGVSEGDRTFLGKRMPQFD
jgi:hypothetical protein